MNSNDRAQKLKDESAPLPMLEIRLWAVADGYVAHSDELGDTFDAWGRTIYEALANFAERYGEDE